jgi:hypothetical protein
MSTFFQNIRISYVQQSIVRLVIGHLTLEEKERVNVNRSLQKKHKKFQVVVYIAIYLDKMHNILQSCPYIFLHIPKPTKFKQVCPTKLDAFWAHIQKQNRCVCVCVCVCVKQQHSPSTYVHG